MAVKQTVRVHRGMENNLINEKVSRGFEKFIGVGVLIISGLFFFLFIYFAITAFNNSALNIGVIFIELTVGLIGYSLAILSIRLITGRGGKRNKYLLSNTSLLFWGTIFGVSGIIEIFLAIFYEERALDIWGIGSIVMVIVGIGTIMMGLGAYRLVKIRRKNNEL